MTPSILPKYGFGCTPHNFPADKGDGAVCYEIGWMKTVIADRSTGRLPPHPEIKLPLLPGRG